MDYNWPEIFKNKTTRELYKIYLGKSSLSSGQEEYARIELERRNFDFVNLDKHRKKWELESLIEEEKSYGNMFLRSYRSWEYLIIGIIGILTTFYTLFLLFKFYLFDKPIGDMTSAFFALIIGSAFALIGFINFKKSRKREIFRKQRLRELIEKL